MLQVFVNLQCIMCCLYRLKTVHCYFCYNTILQDASHWFQKCFRIFSNKNNRNKIRPWKRCKTDVGIKRLKWSYIPRVFVLIISAHRDKLVIKPSPRGPKYSASHQIPNPEVSYWKFENIFLWRCQFKVESICIFSIAVVY